MRSGEILKDEETEPVGHIIINMDMYIEIYILMRLFIWRITKIIYENWKRVWIFCKKIRFRTY